MEVHIKNKAKSVEKPHAEVQGETVSEEKYMAVLKDVMKKHRKSLEILAKH